MNKLLSITTDLLNIVSYEDAPKATVGEAALYALIGFIVVFVGIALLIAVLWLVGKVMAKAQGGEKTAAPVKEKPTVSQTLPVKSETIDGVDEETIAVITAAIMAYYEQQNSRCEFTVKRIKRLNR